mmetsp:Transcript_23035/g.59223  ORF Transcript_23035/g.59223 Transcript_23035/m.59223 type:complete len:295 (+) Transcript_23035:1096-1980(+)
MARRRRRTGSASRGHKVSSTSQSPWHARFFCSLLESSSTRILPTLAFQPTPVYARNSTFSVASATLSPASRSRSRHRPKAADVSTTRDPNRGLAAGETRTARAPMFWRRPEAAEEDREYWPRIRPSMVSWRAATAVVRSSGRVIALMMALLAIPTPTASSSQGTAICTTRPSARLKAGTRSAPGSPTASTASTASRIAKPLFDPSASCSAGRTRPSNSSVVALSTTTSPPTRASAPWLSCTWATIKWCPAGAIQGSTRFTCDRGRSRRAAGDLMRAWRSAWDDPSAAAPWWSRT